MSKRPPNYIQIFSKEFKVLDIQVEERENPMKVVFKIIDWLVGLGLFVLGVITTIGAFADEPSWGVAAYGLVWTYAGFRLIKARKS